MKSATIQDIADLANVSKATVSRVLNNSATVNDGKRRAVLEAVSQLSYQPNSSARSLASGRSMTIGILTQEIGSAFYDTISKGLINGLAGTGYSPIFCDGQWELTSALQGIDSLIARQVDGLVLIGGEIPEADLVQLSERCWTVVVGRKIATEKIPSFSVDNVQAGYIATKHLIDLGHVHIATVCGIATQQDAIDRHIGYETAMKEAKLPIDPDLVFNGDFSARGGVMAVNSLIAKRKHFTAVFAANDLSAMGVRLALYRLGFRVPDDVSIVGVDDQAESSYMTPPLTTVHQPAIELGTRAAQGIVRLLSYHKCDSHQLPVSIRVRESAKRIS